MADHLTWPRWLDTRPHVRPAVHLHEAVRAIARHAKQSPRTMVLEAASENADTGDIKRSRDALSSQGRNRSPVKCEGERLLRTNEFAVRARRRGVFLHDGSPS